MDNEKLEEEIDVLLRHNSLDYWNKRGQILSIVNRECKAAFKAGQKTIIDFQK